MPANEYFTELDGAGEEPWLIGITDGPPRTRFAMNLEGTAWRRHPLVDSQLYDVRAFSSSDVWVSGETGPIWRWDGKSWTQAQLPKPMGDLWGANTNDIWGMRRWGIYHHDGQRWQEAEVN